MSYCDQCAKLLREIATLRADATKAAEELARCEQLVCDFQAAGMIDVGGMKGPCEVKPIHIENHVTELRADLARERERHQWIHCKQRMPPMTERIERDGLSYSKDVIVWNGEKISMAYLCAFDNQPERWVDADGDSNDGVTCWMLPEPPALLEPAPVATGEE